MLRHRRIPLRVPMDWLGLTFGQDLRHHQSGWREVSTGVRAFALTSRMKTISNEPDVTCGKR